MLFMTITELKVYEFLKGKISKEKTDDIIEFMKMTVHPKIEEELKSLATKEGIIKQIAKTKEEFIKTQVAANNDFGLLQGVKIGDIVNLHSALEEDIVCMKEEMAEVSNRLESKVAELKTDRFKWMIEVPIAMQVMLLAILAHYGISIHPDRASTSCVSF